MSSPHNSDQRSTDLCHPHQDETYPSAVLAHRQHQHQQHILHKQQQHMQNFQMHQNNQKHPLYDSEISPVHKRKLYAIKEQLEREEQVDDREGIEVLDVAYDADVDDDMPMKSVGASLAEHGADIVAKADIILDDKQHIYELFQPWALKTYGDLAKTKTITMRKKVRILKALEGKEHSRPDSSKFRFWVKTKGFTTKRPERFEDAPCTQRRKKTLPPNAVLSDNPADVDLFVASSTKDLEKRTYRKVAVVEEFFDIIFQIHMELGGRSGMHAGQKRTYRIISETYAFLPREAVTRFLSICPECKKNLRPSSPSANVKEDLTAEMQNESSSEVEVLNYSSHTESSLEAGPTTKITSYAAGAGSLPPVQPKPKKRRYSNPDNNSKAFVYPVEQPDLNQSLSRRNSSPVIASSTLKQLPAVQTQIPKIRVNPNLQRPCTPPLPESSAFAQPQYGVGFDFHSLKSRDNLVRYYDFMRRLYSGSLMLPHSNMPTNINPSLGLSKDTLQPIISPKTINAPSFSKKSEAKSFEPSVSSSSEDDGDNVTVLTAKRLKSSPECSVKAKALESAPTQLQIPTIDKDFIHSTQIRAINLSKNSSHFSSHDKGGTSTAATPTPKTPSDCPVTSTPTGTKQGIVTSPKTSALSASLRMPQLRTIAGLPPLDFERLKPITSTYLQLTRSMGLSDEEALRFDNVVSNDFKYSL